MAVRLMWRGMLWALVLVAGLQAQPVRAELSADETRTLVERALQWAIDGGIQDFNLALNKSELIVANYTLPPKIQPKVAGHTVTVLSLLRIQARADVNGDFLYFRFAEFTQEDQRVHVPIGLFWAVSVTSHKQYLSGGGAVLDFEKRDGKWELLPVTNKWMS